MSIVEGVVDGVANVRTFGARGDDMVDDSAAIQQAIDESPGPVYFPPGKYRVSNTLIVKKQGMTFFGFSDPRGRGRACMIRYTARTGPLFLFPAGELFGGFSFWNMYLQGVTRKYDTQCMVFETGSTFQTDFNFHRVGMQQFGVPVVLRRSDDMTNRWLGKMIFRQCVISGNERAFVCENSTGVSNLDFLDSEIRQNTGDEPVIDACFRRGSITRCCLEGQPRAILANNSYALTVMQCYFEGNSEYLLAAHHSKGIWFYNNYQRLLSDEEYREPFSLTECSDVRVERPITNNGRWELP
jgi:hypothetical protein